jgi:hypothetical protein
VSGVKTVAARKVQGGEEGGGIRSEEQKCIAAKRKEEGLEED